MLSSSLSVRDDAAKQAVAGDVAMARAADKVRPGHNYVAHPW